MLPPLPFCSVSSWCITPYLDGIWYYVLIGRYCCSVPVYCYVADIYLLYDTDYRDLLFCYLTLWHSPVVYHPLWRIDACSMTWPVITWFTIWWNRHCSRKIWRTIRCRQTAIILPFSRWSNVTVSRLLFCCCITNYTTDLFIALPVYYLFCPCCVVTCVTILPAKSDSVLMPVLNIRDTILMPDSCWCINMTDDTIYDIWCIATMMFLLCSYSSDIVIRRVTFWYWLVLTLIFKIADTISLVYTIDVRGIINFLMPIYDGIFMIVRQWWRH